MPLSAADTAAGTADTDSEPADIAEPAAASADTAASEVEQAAEPADTVAAASADKAADTAVAVPADTAAEPEAVPEFEPEAEGSYPRPSLLLRQQLPWLKRRLTEQDPVRPLFSYRN